MLERNCKTRKGSNRTKSGCMVSDSVITTRKKTTTKREGGGAVK